MTARALLLVDDSVPMRRTIRSLRGPIAQEMYECEDGDEALAAYECHLPDRVVMASTRCTTAVAPRATTSHDPTRSTVL